MPRFTKDNITIETSSAREAVRLRSQGFKEHKARTAEVRRADTQAAATPKQSEKKN